MSSLSGFSLSPQQHRLWLLQRSAAARCTLLLTGDLRAEILKTAVAQVVRRHEILRTTFPRLPGMKVPVMVVAEHLPFHWQDRDFSELPPQEQAAQVEACHDLIPFDFEQGPLLYLSLLKLAAERHLLLISLPALCADAWSFKVLIRELSRSYAACLDGGMVNDPAVQYVQFATWQQQLLAEPEAEIAETYRQSLDGLTQLALPLERPADPAAGFTPKSYPLAISPAIVANLEALAQAHDTTVAVVLLACWQTLIWRLTGQAEIVIGTAYDRRDHPALQDVLGMVATWLPIHFRLLPDLRFSEVLALTQEAVRAAEDWQDFLPGQGSTGSHIGFSLGFEFAKSPELSVAGRVSFALFQQDTWIEPAKLKLIGVRHPDSLQAVLSYDHRFFTLETVQGFAAQFETLLASVTVSPKRAHQLDILPERDRQQLLVEWNQTQAAFPKNECIHHLFETQAQQTPDNIAVQVDQQCLTYAELNRRANQLAHYLQRRGVGPDIVVGLLLDRSLELIIALLGILKAGGAYLPLDPTLPLEGLTRRLQAAQVTLLLTQPGASDFDLEQVICLETAWDKIGQELDQAPTSSVTVENLAYVLFTSGSTGDPKGVAVEHRQLSNYLYAILPQLDLPSGASFAIASTFAADLGNTAIFPSLCTGGCLHILSQERATDPNAFADYCRCYPIDCLKIVPAHLAMLLSGPEPAAILPCQCLVLGGEAVSWDLVERLRQYRPCRVLNHYGPTETTVGVLTYPVQARGQSLANTVPLGRPLANTQVYVLDQHRQPVPVGVPGELYIGGAGLARGYLNQPQLTSEFILSPLPEVSGRLYKTGDRVRYLPDGNLEFLGRVDQQVKIRGYRIEPGEIEAHLTQHPIVREAVVVAREDQPGDKRLVAYVVFNPGAACGSDDLRHYLRSKLPEYQVPASFMLLKRLPLTPNGKVDRQALPAPDPLRPELVATYIAPSNEIEQAIAGVWQTVLQLDQVGLHDNFFDLGGHSLLLVQVHQQLCQCFEQEISISDLFQYPTVSTLADYFRSPQADAGPSSQARAQARKTLTRQRQLRHPRSMTYQ